MNKKILLSGICLTLGLTMNAQNTFPSTGNVGIGTSSPTNSLQINKGTLNGDIKLNGGRLVAGNASDELIAGQYRSKILTDGAFWMKTQNDYTFLTIQQMGLTYNPFISLAIAKDDGSFSNRALSGDVILRSRTQNRSLIIANEEKFAQNDIKFTTTSQTEDWATVKAIIKNNGNVGIGTENPDAKLTVNGEVHAKEVRVDLAIWPDYVFKQDYNLPTIAQAEQHIKEKGHLINMPSAEVVESKGLELGEMTRLQQEKIEELTLYIIELNKRLESLEKSNNQKQ